MRVNSVSAYSHISTQTNSDIGTQTSPDMVKETRQLPRTVRKSASIQANRSSSRRTVRTFVRMKGYPSARVRRLRPPAHVSPSPSPKRRISFPTPRRTDRFSKVDNKGLFIMHLPSPSRRINHSLPNVSKVTTKIDNKGIDIRKWRHSMVNLRNIVDPYDQAEGQKLNDGLKQDIRSAFEKKLSLAPSSPFVTLEEKETQIENAEIKNSRRFSIDSQAQPAVKAKISDDFLSQLRRKLQEKLRRSNSMESEEAEVKGQEARVESLSRRTSLEEEEDIVIENPSSSPSKESSRSSSGYGTQDVSHVLDSEDGKGMENIKEEEETSEEENKNQGEEEENEDEDDEFLEQFRYKHEDNMSDKHQGKQEINKDVESLFTDSSEDEDSKATSLIPPSNLKHNDIIELIHLNSLDLDEINEANGARQPEPRISSSDSSNLSNRNDSAADLNNIDLDMRSNNSSASSVKTILNKPNTPKITVEDYRNKVDRGYFENIITEEVSDKKLESSSQKEESKTKPDLFSLASDLSYSTERSVSQSEDSFVDKRPVSRLPQRSSSIKTEFISLNFCAPCDLCQWCFGCAQANPTYSTKNSANTANHGFATKKIIVKELDMVGVREKDGSISIHSTPIKSMDKPLF